MAHVGSTGLIFPIRQMKGNTIFLESATANIGDLEALIPIMLDPGNQISFKSGHCRVGDQVVVLPAWGRKDNFIAIKGWGAYELSKESFLVFYKMDWTYEGYPGRCTTYSEGYIWKERFWWTTIPGIPAGYPEYFDLQVMRKGLEGHPDPSNSNYPQNCSDGTAVYSDDINVQYSIADPFIPDEALWLPYGEDYMTYYYTAFPKRDNICAIIIPEFGSSYWVDDSFCPAYVEPPEENPKGIAVIQRTTTHEAENSVEEKYATLIALLEELPTFHYETEEELEAFLQEIRDATDALYSEIENYEIENEVWANETKLYWTPTSNDILIRYKKSATPAYIVPDPINLDEGIIEGHGDLLYFGSGEEGQLIHQNLEYNEYYSYTLWNIETRVNEDSEELYVHNRYTGDWYHPYCYPITATVYASVFIEPNELQSCIWNWSGWAFTRSTNTTGGTQTIVTDVMPTFCLSAETGLFGYYVSGQLGGVYAWAKVTTTLTGSISKINLWVGCSGSNILSSGGVRIFVNGVEKWGRTENQFTITGSIGWLEATILLDPEVVDPVVVIERYHNSTHTGNFNAYVSSLYIE